MLSIEEIKLLIEKLEKVKKHDFGKLIDENLGILKNIADTVDILNNEQINRLDKTLDWFCLLYTSPSPRDRTRSRMPSSA